MGICDAQQTSQVLQTVKVADIATVAIGCDSGIVEGSSQWQMNDCLQIVCAGGNNQQEASFEFFCHNKALLSSWVLGLQHLATARHTHQISTGKELWLKLRCRFHLLIHHAAFQRTPKTLTSNDPSQSAHRR